MISIIFEKSSSFYGNCAVSCYMTSSIHFNSRDNRNECSQMLDITMIIHFATYVALKS